MISKNGGSSLFLKSLATVVLVLILAMAAMGSGIAPAAYNLILNNNVGITQRSKLNFVNGGCVDNAGTLSSDCTFLTASSVPANATCAFTAQTTVTCTHGLGTTAVVVTVYNAASPPQLIIPDTVKTTNSNVVTATFTASTSGTIVVNGSAGSGGAVTTAQTRRVCGMVVGADNGSALANADLGPQGRQCYVPYGATVVEIDVAADAGTPNVIPGRNHAGTIANLVSSALATAAAGGLACSNTGGTVGLDGVTTCSATLQNTVLAIGDWVELVSGTAGGVAKRMSIAVTYTVP